MNTTRMSVRGVHSTGVVVRVSTGQREPELKNFEAFATVSIDGGAFGLQTYLTPAECEELSSMLLLAAKEVRELVADEVAA